MLFVLEAGGREVQKANDFWMATRYWSWQTHRMHMDVGERQNLQNVCFCEDKSFTALEKTNIKYT